MSKQRWPILRGYIIGWTLAFIFLSIIRGVGTTELGSVQFELDRTLLISVVFGVVFGSISGLAQIVTEEKIYKRTSLPRLILTRLAFSFIFLVALILVSYVMVTTLFGVTISLVDFFTEPGSFAIYLYMFVVDVFLTFVRQINLMLGKGNLLKLITGRFYEPHEEERIFMFIDLKSSTTIAERLGHVKYSMLIQDCFTDLGIVENYDAGIYQYVGDEAILTWDTRSGLSKSRCLKAFLAFQNELSRKAEYYQSKYDCIPFFKAGVHMGKVTITEVGKYKKEIAYHGDTLNTTARIQSMCNTYNQPILLSEAIVSRLPENGFHFEEIGDVSLKGKSEIIRLHALSESK